MVTRTMKDEQKQIIPPKKSFTINRTEQISVVQLTLIFIIYFSYLHTRKFSSRGKCRTWFIKNLKGKKLLSINIQKIQKLIF